MRNEDKIRIFEKKGTNIFIVYVQFLIKMIMLRKGYKKKKNSWGFMAFFCFLMFNPRKIVLFLFKIRFPVSFHYFIFLTA